MDTMTTSTTAATESTGTSELTTQTTGPTTARRHRKLQRMISGLLALLGLSLIGLTAAPAAQAAGTSTLTACFKTTVNVYGIGPVSGPYTRPVMLDASNGSQSWLGLWSESPSMRGCLIVSVSTGYYWRFRIAFTEAGKTYLARTGWQYVQSGYNYDFGTIFVQSV